MNLLTFYIEKNYPNYKLFLREDIPTINMLIEALDNNQNGHRQFPLLKGYINQKRISFI